MIKLIEMKLFMKKELLLILLFGVMLISLNAQKKSEIVHDAEYYILEAQNGEVWEVEDGQLDKKLAESNAKFPEPNPDYMPRD